MRAHGAANLQSCALDASSQPLLLQHLSAHPVDAVISSLPFYCNVAVAEAARKAGVHYFDLTEDVEVTRAVRAIATGSDQAFVPQCGLAPGFISIAAAELITHFDELRSVKLRVGALPQHPNNVLKYSLTWSTEGLINEYGNPCQAIVEGRIQRCRAARGTRGDRDRWHALRGFQHLRRTRLAGRDPRHSLRAHELQDHPLSGSLRADAPADE